jgi:hypothetical protein
MLPLDLSNTRPRLTDPKDEAVELAPKSDTLRAVDRREPPLGTPGAHTTRCGRGCAAVHRSSHHALTMRRLRSRQSPEGGPPGPRARYSYYLSGSAVSAGRPIPCWDAMLRPALVASFSPYEALGGLLGGGGYFWGGGIHTIVPVFPLSVRRRCALGFPKKDRTILYTFLIASQKINYFVQLPVRLYTHG